MELRLLGIVCSSAFNVNIHVQTITLIFYYYRLIINITDQFSFVIWSLSCFWRTCALRAIFELYLRSQWSSGHLNYFLIGFRFLEWSLFYLSFEDYSYSACIFFKSSTCSLILLYAFLIDCSSWSIYCCFWRNIWKSMYKS